MVTGEGVVAAGNSVISSRVATSRTLAVASFGAFLAFLDATVVNVAFPSIRASFPHASIGELSWVLNSYNIAFASFLIVFDRLADLMGRKRLFSLGTLVFTLASLWCAASGSIEMLIAARAVQAVGAAMLVPASLAIVVEAFPAERRSHAVGLWGASAAVAAGLGPPIGGALVQWGDWRWAFLVNLPFGVVALVLDRRSLVESRAPGRRRMPDLRGALLMAASTSFLTLAIVQGNTWGWSSVRVLGSVALAVLLAGGFVASSRVHPQPLLDPALLRIRPFVVGNLVTLVAGMGFYAYLLTNVLWLRYVWQYSLLEAGLALVPGAVVAAVTAALLGEFAQHHGYRKVIVPGAVVWCAAYLWYAFVVGPEPAFLSQWLPGQVLSGLGVGATLPLLGSAVLAAVPGGRFATASAALSSTRQFGGVLGIAILVAIIGSPTPSNVLAVLPHGWIFCAISFGVVALGTVALGDLSRIIVAEETPEGGQAPHLPDPGLLPAPRQPTQDTIPTRILARLEDTGEQVALRAGDWLFEAGDDADAMFVLHTGRLDVVVDGRVVRELGPGSLVGELGLLAGEGERSASVRARRDASLLKVTRRDFEKVMSDGDAPLALASALAAQLQSPAPPRDPSRGGAVGDRGARPASGRTPSTRSPRRSGPG
jgi:NTE family protein